MAVPGAAVAYSAIGGLVLYSGVKGATLADTVKAVLKGNLNVAGTEPVGDGTAGATPAGGSGAVPSGSAAKAQAYARSQMSHYGWDPAGGDWDALVKLWNQESGWSNVARNPQSGAYGIAQALPPTKYPAAGQAPPAGTSDAEAQIGWGMDYIRQRYGSPQMAWAHEQANNWY